MLNPLLPDRGERGPAIANKRRTVNGILWVLRTGAPWRDMPEQYGNWNSVFVRFTRWSKLGVWDAAFETVAGLGPPADEEHAIEEQLSQVLMLGVFHLILLVEASFCGPGGFRYGAVPDWSCSAR